MISSLPAHRVTYMIGLLALNEPTVTLWCLDAKSPSVIVCVLHLSGSCIVWRRFIVLWSHTILSMSQMSGGFLGYLTLCQLQTLYGEWDVEVAIIGERTWPIRSQHDDIFNSDRNFICISHPSHPCYMFRPSHSLFDHLNDIW